MNEINLNLKEKYFLKIAPDFSVFDMLEKYLSNQTLDLNQEKIFFNSFPTAAEDIETPFYRAIFKIDMKENSSPSLINSEKNFIVIKDEELSIEDEDHCIFYLIGIDEELLKIKNFPSNKIHSIMGVAF